MKGWRDMGMDNWQILRTAHFTGLICYFWKIHREWRWQWIWVSVGVHACVCVCVCICILQSGPWPTLKPSHHSDPLGLQISSLCMCVYIKSLYYKKSHTINLFLPAHTLLHYWVWKEGCTAVHVYASICEGSGPPKVSPTGWFIISYVFSTCFLSLALSYTDMSQTVPLSIPLFSSIIFHKPQQSLSGM